MQFSIYYDNCFFNWLRTSCVVSIQLRLDKPKTAEVWADFEEHMTGQ